jgi:ABC-type branched-subunit amino acid transport system substrate-binding protein
MISGSATNPKVTEQGFKNVFRTVGRDDQQGPAIAAYVANEMKAKKVAIADDATAYGEGLANEVEKTLKAAGVQIVAREKTNDKATDFKAILTKMKGKNPDTIFYGGMDATGGPMIKQARSSASRQRLPLVTVRAPRKAKLGPAAEGLVCSQAAFRRRWRRRTSRRRSRRVRRSQTIRAVLLRRQDPDRRDAARRLDRPGQVPAGNRQIKFDGATGPSSSTKGRPQDAE